MSYRAVYKFPMDQPVITAEMDPDATILTVETQGGVPTIWALVDLEAKTVKREFIGYGTGHPIPEDGLTYVGSAHDVYGDGLVLHIFERR